MPYCYMSQHREEIRRQLQEVISEVEDTKNCLDGYDCDEEWINRVKTAINMVIELV